MTRWYSYGVSDGRSWARCDEEYVAPELPHAAIVNAIGVAGTADYFEVGMLDLDRALEEYDRGFRDGCAAERHESGLR